MKNISIVLTLLSTTLSIGAPASILSNANSISFNDNLEFDKTNVLSDLLSSDNFNILDYPYKENEGIKIINFIEYEYSTYIAVFDDVKIFFVSNKDRTDKQNLILVGIKGNPEIDETKASEYWQYLDMEVTDFKTDKPIVTDDFAPIGD